jgi:50S ribosomal protein L16 3-hydroxylase
MTRHWHRRSLLLRAALAEAQSVIDESALLSLAGRDDVESRLVIRDGQQYMLEHGPFTRARFRRLPARDWTLLVQGLDHHVPAAARLLEHFRFVPQARLDDVMVSLAAPGGGVGPHVDSYDVFLLQGPGRRHWRYGPQKDLSLDPEQPLKILRHFSPRSDEILEPGDMLYLPPHVAHDGVAIDRCMTFSIGFRAPQAGEIVRGFLEYLTDTIDLPGRFADPGRQPAAHAGQVPADLLDWIQTTVQRVRWQPSDIARFATEYLSTPKPHVIFERPDPALSRRAFLGRIRSTGLRLDARSILLYQGSTICLNGSRVEPIDGPHSRWLRQLADARNADAPPGPALDDWLHAAYVCGELLPGKT